MARTLPSICTPVLIRRGQQESMGSLSDLPSLMNWDLGKFMLLNIKI